MRKLLHFLIISLLSHTSYFTSTVMAQSKFEIQGHRGCRGLMPENTLPAFQKAIDLGVHTLELDVVISKDGKVVVSHEPHFNPNISTDSKGKFVTKETTGNLFEMKYAQIKKYDVGLRGNPNYPEQQKMAVHKPLLSDVLKMVEKHCKQKGIPLIKYNIEIKSLETEYGKTQPEVGTFSDLVHQQIFKYIRPEQVTIQSFDFNVLKHWHQQMGLGNYKKVFLAALIEPTDNNEVTFNLNKLGFQPNIWSPYFATLNENRVKELHQLGIRIIPWTVNKREDMEKVKALGCDGLITDYPDRTQGL